MSQSSPEGMFHSPIIQPDTSTGSIRRQATWKDWLSGARPRTLPAAAAPVVVGTCSSIYLGSWKPLHAVLALIVALALQVGVNYANDYSDGIRGTDEARVGPLRLTGSDLTTPRTVLFAALASFTVAGIAGLGLLALSRQWFLIIFGIAAVIAAWLYTGGRHPYGYAGYGLSELMVFLFFGLFACVGTTWTQVQQAPAWLWSLASGLGLISVALLLVNNIRDIPTDTKAGKHTVAVRLGQKTSRFLFALALVLSVVLLVCSIVSIGGSPLSAVLVVVVLFGPLVITARPVCEGARGTDLIPSLKNTGLFTLAWSMVACLALLFV